MSKPRKEIMKQISQLFEQYAQSKEKIEADILSPTEYVNDFETPLVRI